MIAIATMKPLRNQTGLLLCPEGPSDYAKERYSQADAGHPMRALTVTSCRNTAR